jgi:excisionase family DNA binding protein
MQTPQPYSLTIPAACARYGIGRTLLYELLGSGKIEAVKLGKRTLILAESVERYMESLPRLERASTFQ